MNRFPTSLTATATAVLAVVALYWVGIWVAHGNNAERGTTPDWIAAIATLAAFGAAVFAGWYAHKAFSVERDRELKQQAAQVAAWGGEVKHAGLDAKGNWIARAKGLQTYDGPPYPMHIPVTIMNIAPLPVFELDVDLYAFTSKSLTTVHVGTYRHPDLHFIGTEEVDIISPEMVEHMIPILETLPSPTPGEPFDFTVGWRFTDVAGIRWRRAPGRPLERIPRDA